MALLQISEPGQSPDPHQRRVAIGIDLGTTHSLVAAVRHGAAECLPDEQGRRLLPSAVRYGPQRDVQVGWGALEQAGDDAHNTVTSVKRLMGKSLADLPQAQRLPYEVVEGAGTVMVRTHFGDKSPVEISAHILATLRQRAEDTFNEDVDGAVITVPAYFDDAQRQATKDAAELAGLRVLRLINEPTAAAIAYGLEHGSEGLFVVYDLGGGTFDISILRLTRGVFEVVATGGDSALGGDDFDAALAAWACEQAGVEVASVHERRALLSAARRAKELLSERETAELTCCLGNRALNLMVERELFEQLSAPLIERTLQAARRVLRDARCERSELDGVVLVGGATRMPCVRRAVGGFFDRPVLTDLNPDEVVSLGAAVQANALVGNDPNGDLLLLDVIPLSLGLETMGGLVERIIERNTTIPAAKAQDFTTYLDGQTAMALHVVQGEREMVSDCRSLARFELHGIPAMTAGAARIRVTFQVDADGLLSVSAREETTGVQAHIEVKPSYGLADDEVARMLHDSFSHAEEDLQLRVLREAQVDGRRLLLATRAALDVDAELLTEKQLTQIEAHMTVLEREISAAAQSASIENAIKALADATEGFAAARMNRSLRQALAGRHLEDV